MVQPWSCQEADMAVQPEVAAASRSSASDGRGFSLFFAVRLAAYWGLN